jgi:hypothetical protein
MKNMKDFLSLANFTLWLIMATFTKRKGPEIDKTVRIWSLKNSQSGENCRRFQGASL